MISPLPGVTATKPGSCTQPLPGIDATIVDAHGKPVKGADAGGYLVIRKPWPSMLRTIWGDNERYLETYWETFQNRYYVAGDCAHRDKDGYFWIMGRIDDVLNVAGHRLGTMEIESALVAHPQVAEAAVVGKPHEIKGESVFAFVVLRGERPTGDSRARCAKKLRDWVTEQLGAIAQARRHPLCRQPAQDALGQDHAPAAARHRAQRGHHAGPLDAGESGDHRSAARRASRRGSPPKPAGKRQRRRPRRRKTKPAKAKPATAKKAARRKASREEVGASRQRRPAKKAARGKKTSAKSRGAAPEEMTLSARAPHQAEHRREMAGHAAEHEQVPHRVRVASATSRRRTARRRCKPGRRRAIQASSRSVSVVAQRLDRDDDQPAHAEIERGRQARITEAHRGLRHDAEHRQRPDHAEQRPAPGSLHGHAA